MNLVSLTDCCRWLAIDPKTLRRWMSLSHLQALPHPLDARCKCLTSDMVQQLAATHRRTLQAEPERPFQPETKALSTPTSVKSVPALSSALPDGSALIASLLQQLGSLQAQLTLLADQRSQQQQWSRSQAETGSDQSLQSPEVKSPQSCQDKSRESSQDKSLESPQDKSRESSQDKSRESFSEKEAASVVANTASIDRRKLPHVLPLVEYGAEGKYVVISPGEGLLDFEPDSPQWFAWLSTLSSFRFVGASGHFTVHRNGCSSRWSWRATRSIHSRPHSLHLVRTEFLTIAVLEQAAASLQSRLS